MPYGNPERLKANVHSHDSFYPEKTEQARYYLRQLNHENRRGYSLRLRPTIDWQLHWRNHAEETTPLDEIPGERGVRYIEWDDTRMQRKLQRAKQPENLRTRLPGEREWFKIYDILWSVASEALYIGGTKHPVEKRVEEHLNPETRSVSSLVHWQPEFYSAHDGYPGRWEYAIANELTTGVFKDDGSLRAPEEIAEEGIVAIAPG